MKNPALAVIAWLMLAPAPAWSADMPANATELHIEASGSVVADYADYDTTETVTEHGQAACEATLAETLARIRGHLVAVDLPAGAVKLTASACVASPDGDGSMAGFRGVETVANPNFVAAPNATLSAAAAAAAEGNARIAAERERMKLPLFDGRIAVSVKVTDLSKLAAVKRAGGGLQVGPDAARTAYVFNHPDDVQKIALASALAKARKEADLFAAAVGCHVLRVARISNHAGSPSLTDIVNLFVQMRGTELEWQIPASRSVSVAIDYVIVPD